MAKKPETIFGENVDKDLKSTFGGDVLIFNIQQAAIRNTPDRLICLRGDFIAIELKSTGGVLSRGQYLKLRKINRAGGKAFVAYPETWRFVLDELTATYGR